MRGPFNGLIWLLAFGGTISACHHEGNPCDDLPVGYPVAALPILELEWVATARYTDGGTVDLQDLKSCCEPRVTPGCDPTCPPPQVEFYRIGPPYAGAHCQNADFPPGGVLECFVLALDGGVLDSVANCYD